MKQLSFLYKAIFWFCILLLTVSSLSAQQMPEKGNEIGTLYNCNIVDTDSGEILYGQTVVVEDGVIIKISPSKKRIKKGEIDLSGKYIMPGLIDSHTHWGSFGQDSTMAAELSAEYLKCGVTTVRDVGGNVLNIKDHLKHVAEGAYMGPDVYYSSFWATGDYHIMDYDYRGWDGDKNACPWSRMFSVKDSTNQAIERAVLEAKAIGCTGFKLYINYSEEDLARIIPIIKKHGMKVWGHASQVHGAKAIDVAGSGIEVVSHAYMLVDIFESRDSLTFEELEYVKQVCKVLKKNDIVLDITAHISLEGDMPYSVDIIKEAYAAGVRFVVGTDYFGCAVPDEIKRLKECGISNIDILRAATLTGAEIIGQAGKLGVIAEGAEADIIVLPGNPVEDLDVLNSVEATIVDGRIGDID